MEDKIISRQHKITMQNRSREALPGSRTWFPLMKIRSCLGYRHGAFDHQRKGSACEPPDIGKRRGRSCWFH